MPLEYTIDETRGLVLTVATGRLTDAELLAHKEALLADPLFRPGMRELSDVRGVDALEVTPAGIARAVGFDRRHTEHLGTHQLALLVPTDFVFGMARMYEQRTEGHTGHVVVLRDEAEARAWLEADQPTN